MANKINKKTYIYFITLILIPILSSYFSNELLKIYHSIFLPCFLCTVFIMYFAQQKKSFYLLIVLYTSIGLLQIIYIYGLTAKELLHFFSYLLLMIGSYLFAYYTTLDRTKIDQNLKDIFGSIILIYFLSIIFHHIFVYFNIGEGIFFWKVSIYDKIRMQPAVLSNIGNGKNVTAMLSSLCAISIFALSKYAVSRWLFMLLVLGLGLLSFSRAFIVSLFSLFFLYNLNLILKRPIYFLICVFSGILVFYGLIQSEYIADRLIREDIGEIQSIKRYILMSSLIDIVKDYSLNGIGWAMLDYKLGYYLEFGKTEIGIILFLIEQGFLRGGILVIIIIYSFFVTMKALVFEMFPKGSMPFFALIASSVTIFYGFIWGNNIVSDIRSFIFWFFVFFPICLLNMQKRSDKKSEYSKSLYDDQHQYSRKPVCYSIQTTENLKG